MPCTHCGEYDWIRWENIRWDEGDPSTAALVCVHCGGVIEEHEKTAFLANGEWRATATSESGTIGFHLSSLYSPLGWKSWASCATEFLAVKEDVFKFKTWINTILGETWEERGDSADPHVAESRPQIDPRAALRPDSPSRPAAFWTEPSAATCAEKRGDVTAACSFQPFEA